MMPKPAAPSLGRGRRQNRHFSSHYDPYAYHEHERIAAGGHYAASDRADINATQRNSSAAGDWAACRSEKDGESQRGR
jgi:hypothetical protein